MIYFGISKTSSILMENQEIEMIFDLHIHSKYSHDSILEPHKIIEGAKKKD